MYNNPVYMGAWHDAAAGTVVLPAISTIQGVNFSVNNQDDDHDYQLQLHYAVSESL
jgi:hypothetical protein